eukprot:573147-Pelagomonas_calceolata.AAC.4
MAAVAKLPPPPHQMSRQLRDGCSAAAAAAAAVGSLPDVLGVVRGMSPLRATALKDACTWGRIPVP